MARYLIAYDVGATARRNKLAARLEDMGMRIQKSVFLAEAGPEAAPQLARELQEYLETGDSLLIVPLCGQCFRKALLTAEEKPLLLLL